MTESIVGQSVIEFDPIIIRGQDGKSVTGASIDGNGHLQLTFSDNTTHDAGAIAGGLVQSVDGHTGAVNLSTSYAPVSGSANYVSTAAQTISDGGAQARANIGAAADAEVVKVDAQTLSYTEQAQILANVGFHFLIAPAPSGDTTGATDAAALTTAVNALGYVAGITPPDGSKPLRLLLPPGDYYINAPLPAIRPGMQIESLGSTRIFCIGGTAGVPFIHTYDPSFSTIGTALPSQRGQLRGIVLDGSRSVAGAIGVQRGDIIRHDLDITVQNFGGIVLPTVTGTNTLTVNGRSDSVTTTANRLPLSDTAIVAADLGAAVSGTGIPSSAHVSGVIVGQSFTLGTASGAAPANATVSGSQSLQVGWARTDTVTLTSGSNVIPDTSAAAADLGMPVFGTGIPVGAFVTVVNPGVSLTIGYRAIGLYYASLTGWCERHTDHVTTFNCAQHIVLDGSTGPYASFDYNNFDWEITADHGQVAVSIRGGAQFVGTDISVRGGHTSHGAANPGIGLMQSGGSKFAPKSLDWALEQDSGGTGLQGAVPHFLADSVSTFYCSGSSFRFEEGAFTNWQSSYTRTAILSAGGSQIAFSGDIGGTWGIVSPAGYGRGARRVSGLLTTGRGSGSPSGTTITLSFATGNIFAPSTLTAGTAYAIVFDGAPQSSIGSNQAVELTVILTQPGSGSPATISSWLSGTVTWAAGSTGALNSALGSKSVFRLTSTDGGATWVGTGG